jgi:hypothetical protein
MRILAVVALVLSTFAAISPAQPAKSPLAPRTIKWEKPGGTLGDVAAALTKQSGGPPHRGVPIEMTDELRKKPCNVKFDGTPFWDALQQAADRTGTRITLAEDGRKVVLVPRSASKEVSAASGPFRVVAQKVVGTALLADGATFHEVQLLTHWEPRFRVYRIDQRPKVVKAADDRGATLTPVAGAGRELPSGAQVDMTVKLEGLTRDSKRIGVLAGEFTVTATDELLTFTFDPTQKLPLESKHPSGVSATLRRVEKQDDTWVIEVELKYPPNQPVFESFEGEWWLKDNRLVLQSPTKSFVLDDFNFKTRGNVVATHSYKEDPAKGLGPPTAKGWSIVYETPAPLVEVKVPFELKNIPLP